MSVLPDPAGSGLTFKQLQDRALHDDFSATKYRDLVKDFINDALHEIYRTTRLAESDEVDTVELEAGENTYALPTDSIRVDSLRDPLLTGGELRELHIATIDNLAVTTGAPTHYSLNKGNLVLWPTPAAVGSLELRYRLDATDLVDDDDYAGLQPSYRKLLVQYARAELFALEDDDKMEAFWRSKWEAGLKTLRADLQRHSRRVRRVPSMWSR